jgi:hypothetical protein
MALVIPRFKIITGGKFVSIELPPDSMKKLSAALITGKITK